LAIALNRPGIPARDVSHAHHDVSHIDPILIRDVVLVSALTSLMNRVIDGLGAWATDEMHRRNGARIAQQGYLPAAEQIRETLLEAGHSAIAVPRESGHSFPAFGDRDVVLTWLFRFQNDLLDGGPVPPPQARAVRAAVAAANGLITGSPDPDAFIDYAVEVTLDPRWRGPNESKRLYEAGATDAHVLQVVLIAALANFLARVIVGLPNLFDRNAVEQMIGTQP
jgi:hypothetical protein